MPRGAAVTSRPQVPRQCAADGYECVHVTRACAATRAPAPAANRATAASKRKRVAVPSRSISAPASTMPTRPADAEAHEAVERLPAGGVLRRHEPHHERHDARWNAENVNTCASCTRRRRPRTSRPPTSSHRTTVTATGERDQVDRLRSIRAPAPEVEEHHLDDDREREREARHGVREAERTHVQREEPAPRAGARLHQEHRSRGTSLSAGVTSAHGARASSGSPRWPRGRKSSTGASVICGATSRTGSRRGRTCGRAARCRPRPR